VIWVCGSRWSPWWCPVSTILTDELMDAARLYQLPFRKHIPWHVTAFHPDYKMTDPPRTSARTLERAAEIGQEAGLHYVYAGNLPGRLC
jgi:pyruvate formate lyase activating enzyme